MGVNIENARIEIELDVRRALEDLQEVESGLGRARGRRRRGRDGAALDRDRGRPGARGAAVAVTAATAARGGLRRAVAFAAKLGAGLTVAEVIRNTPEIVRAVIGEETLGKRLVDLLPLPDTAKEILAANEIGATRIGELVNDLSKRIAQVEGTLKTTVRAATLAYDLMMEGKIPEAGAAAISEIRRAFSGESAGPGAAEALGIAAEALEILDAFRAYNTAESLFRQRARGVQIRNSVEDLDNLFRAAGGGASK